MPIRTLSEMGRTLGVSAERVRQIQEAALAKLQPHELGEPSRFQPGDPLLAFLDSL